MSQIWADRVKEASVTTGTGAFTLAGAVVGFRAFSSVCANADTVCYCITNREVLTEWEVGLGTWNTGGTLTRTTVYASSNSGNAVNFSSGVKDVFLTYPATQVVATSGATMTGPLLLPAGTALAPSVGWAADADGTGTGCYRPAANQWGLTINGTLTHLWVANRFLIRSVNADITMGTSDDLTIARRAAGTPVASLGGATFSAATNSVTIGGVANVNTTSQATTGTSEEVLATYTLPANALSANGKGVRITAWTTGTGAGQKITRIRFGGLAGTIVAGTVSSGGAGVHVVHATVLRTGAATQVAMGQGFINGGSANNTGSSPTQTLSGTVDIVVTGTSAVAGEQTFTAMFVEFFN